MSVRTRENANSRLTVRHACIDVAVENQHLDVLNQIRVHGLGEIRRGGADDAYAHNTSRANNIQAHNTDRQLSHQTTGWHKPPGGTHSYCTLDEQMFHSPKYFLPDATWMACCTAALFRYGLAARWSMHRDRPGSSKTPLVTADPLHPPSRCAI